MNKDNKLITKYINAIQKDIDEYKNLEDSDDSILLKIIEENINDWENFLLPLCKINKISYYKTIEKILEESGIRINNNQKIIVYISRIKTKLGEKNG